MSIVLDASMTIAWLFHDERTPATEAVLRRVVAEGAVVPSLWRIEVANVLRNAVRRRRCDNAYVDRSLQRLRRLVIETDKETDDRTWGATLGLAREQDLTLYDATYLELAIRTDHPLASCDGPLLAAAARRHVKVLAA
ncbi:MAG TPA: type II toxin-antitoxin system VapC family toxin [Rhizomicrobium sp.]|jgi:predicted nucleic acid-binding protein|nr:type II toxin-antitoxin system VapC family toxin [Rhizomicrobium sp.]